MIGRRIGLEEINCEGRPPGGLSHTAPPTKKVYP